MAGPQAGLRPGFRRVLAAELPNECVERIAAAAKARGKGNAAVQGNLGGEVGLFGVGALLLLGGIALVAMAPSSVTWREPAAILSGVALLALGFALLKRRSRASLGTFFLQTSAYIIDSDGGVLRTWNLARCVGSKVTNHYVNGIYSSTALELAFPDGEPFVISDHLGGAATTVIDAGGRSQILGSVLRAVEEARQAEQAGRWAAIDGASLLP